MRRGSSLQIAAGAMATLLLAAASCSSDKASAPPPVITEPVPVVSRADDGVLTIGVLTPQGSAFADIGQSIGRGAQLAVQDINTAGGFDGTSVEMIPEDEDVQGSGVEAAITKLLDEKVDAIGGPASSTNALAAVGGIVGPGVVAGPPAGSAHNAHPFPGPDPVFRPVPPDPLPGGAIARGVGQTGGGKTTNRLHRGCFGQAFESSVSDALQ